MQEQRTTAALPSLAPKSVAKVCVSLSPLLFLPKDERAKFLSYSLLPLANLQSLGTGSAHSFFCPSLSCVAQSTYRDRLITRAQVLRTRG